jgi:HK97 family phage portal protein
MFKAIKNLFTPDAKVEKKSYSPFMAFANYLALNGWSNLSAYQAMLYYMQVSPLFDAINKITTECSGINLTLQDKATKKYIDQHQLLDLFQLPNTDLCRSEFIESLAAYYLITGNVYVCATGDVNKPPLELFVISPEYVTLTPSERDGYIQTITYSSNTRSISFHRETVAGRFRFYNEEKNQEIYSIRRFNPIKSVTNNYGLSQLTPLFFDIEQYIKSALHNTSLLTRGGRPSGALRTAETLSDEAFARLQEQMDRFVAGPENTGRLMVLDSGLEFTEMATSNKDMDFEKLQDRLTTRIYNTFSIPLPLIAQGHMSYNNLETARLMLYDFAVLPCINRLTEELSAFLMYRYKEQTKILTYNKRTIPALMLRHNEEMLQTKNLAINSLNELRAMRGDTPAIGGDDIFTSSGFPIARVGNNVLSREEETEDSSIQDEDEKVLHMDYYLMMKRRRKLDGSPAFSEEELKQLAVRYGLD